jgi:hypothetical protein
MFSRLIPAASATKVPLPESVEGKDYVSDPCTVKLCGAGRLSQRIRLNQRNPTTKAVKFPLPEPVEGSGIFFVIQPEC